MSMNPSVISPASILSADTVIFCTSLTCIPLETPPHSTSVVSTSSPTGHFRREQSGPVKYGSHLHPRAWFLSQPEYCFEVMSSTNVHLPCPEQSFGQEFLSHAAPVKPAPQTHSPLSRSQTPLLEHSEYACTPPALFLSAKAVPNGHFLREQSTPIKLA